MQAIILTNLVNMIMGRFLGAIITPKKGLAMIILLMGLMLGEVLDSREIFSRFEIGFNTFSFKIDETLIIDD